jgi:NADH-quinone oxidoreductase subunit C
MSDQGATPENEATDTAAAANGAAVERKPISSQEVFAALKAEFGEEAILEHVEGIAATAVFVAAEKWREVAAHLRDDPGLRFDFLINVTAVDWPDDQVIESVYHLYSMTHRHHLTVKIKLPREKPEVPSVVAIWPAADWHEREQYDMMGVIYVGHPNLRRILLAEDWEGYPLRKDYVIPDEIHGVSNLP